MNATGELTTSPAGQMACELARQLECRRIVATVSEVKGVALVGLWAVGLPVWCEWDQTFGWRYRWWTDTNTDTGDRKFAQCAGIATDTAVRRIVDRYWELHGALVASPKLRVPGENAVSTGG